MREVSSRYDGLEHFKWFCKGLLRSNVTMRGCYDPMAIPELDSRADVLLSSGCIFSTRRTFYKALSDAEELLEVLDDFLQEAVDDIAYLQRKRQNILNLVTETNWELSLPWLQMANGLCMITDGTIEQIKGCMRVALDEHARISSRLNTL
jgi:hypothetical protein